MIMCIFFSLVFASALVCAQTIPDPTATPPYMGPSERVPNWNVANPHTLGDPAKISDFEDAVGHLKSLLTSAIIATSNGGGSGGDVEDKKTLQSLENTRLALCNGTFWLNLDQPNPNRPAGAVGLTSAPHVAFDENLWCNAPGSPAFIGVLYSAILHELKHNTQQTPWAPQTGPTEDQGRINMVMGMPLEVEAVRCEKIAADTIYFTGQITPPVFAPAVTMRQYCSMLYSALGSAESYRSELQAADLSSYSQTVQDSAARTISEFDAAISTIHHCMTLFCD